MQNSSEYEKVCITNLMIHLVGASSYILPPNEGGVVGINLSKIENPEFRELLGMLRVNLAQFRKFLDNRSNTTFDALFELNSEMLDKGAMVLEACATLDNREIEDVIIALRNKTLQKAKLNKKRK